jgi:hypothetical protein
MMHTQFSESRRDGMFIVLTDSFHFLEPIYGRQNIPLLTELCF